VSSQLRLLTGGHKARRSQRGFSVLEIAVVLLVMMVLFACSIPLFQATLYNFRLNGAVSSATWAIQSTRYQALMEGYPFRVTFNSANNTYQIASEPLGTNTFTNVGSAVPLSGDPIALSQTTTIQLNPNGYVSAPVGSLSFQILYQGISKTIQVNNYGNVKVSSP
jgi:Tfp pilus assembly protein FimT